MRIGLLNPTVLIRRPIAELAQSLLQRGFEVTLITPIDDSAPAVPAHYQRRPIPTVELPSREFQSVLWSWPRWSAWQRLWRTVAEVDILHIWAPYYLVAVLAIFFAKLHGSKVKIILTFDTFPGFSFFFRSSIDLAMRIYHWCFGSWAFRLVDARTLYSAQLLPYAVQAGLGRSFQIIPTGVYLQPGHSASAATSGSAILFIGLINQRKGVFVLLEAAELLKNDHVNFTLTMVGEGPERVACEEYVAQHGLASHVRLVGRTSNVSSFFHQTDIFVLPSFGEGLPGVVMEAMTYGVPVVATNIPCLAELIPDAKHGQLVEAGNARALADALRTYLQDRPLRQRVAVQALHHIRSFSWEQITPQYERLYTQLAA